ncbi:MAG: hypothetical protein DRO67_01465 [Candidatus Asgardarchaeum californiense]|nr:MAG: hypothetical protein DRO67_01465 [Candidatus Asgardarchaeum californiense]
MLTRLGKIIEKKPWVVVVLVLIITVIFSLFIPALQFKTDFSEFAPDDETVRANTRILDYFGMNQQVMLLLAEKQHSDSTISPQALREMYFIQKELDKNPDVISTVSITTFVDAVCQIEFGKTLDNCTDEQIQTALQDMLSEQKTEEIQILSTDDPNEQVDYRKNHLIFSKEKSIDSTDIKNCYLSRCNDTLTFSIEVYDLSDFRSTLKPSFPRVNVMEWYIDFKNLVIPDKRADINYEIAAHIEPTHPIWEIGKGIFKNIKELIQLIRDRELFNSYTKEAYLWIEPPGQTMFFPMPLKTGNITFDTDKNRVNIAVSLDELREFGIAPQFGSFELPAKLSNFNAGVRYYQSPYPLLSGGRVTANTSFIFNKIENIRERPILGTIAEKILKKYGDVTWEDYDKMFEMMEQTDLIPDTISLRDIQSNWIQSDEAPDTGTSKAVFTIYPYFFSDMQVDVLSFLSKDYKQTNSSKESLIIVQLNRGEDYDEILRINREVLQQINMLDKQKNFISIEATGEGVVSSQINEETTEANQIIGVSIFIIIMIVLFIFFREISYVFLPMVSLAISAIWLFGTMALLGISFNVIAVALVPLIMGLGVDYSVHLFHNYRIEVENGVSLGKAIKRSVKEIGTAMFLAMITTVIAFMSFLTSNVPPIRNFGTLLALGIIYTFITAVTILASSRYILDRRKKIKTEKKTKRFLLKDVMDKASHLVLHHQKKILMIMIVITLFMASGALQLEKGFNMNQFVPENNTSIQLFEKIADDFPHSSQDREYIFIEGNVATVKTLKGIAQTYKNLDDDIYVSRRADGSVKATSIYTIIQQAIENNQSLLKLYNIDEATGIPRTDRDVYELYEYLYNRNNFDTSNVAASQSDIMEWADSMAIKTVLHRNNSRYDATIIQVFANTSLTTGEGNLNDKLEVFKKELNNDIESYGSATAIVTGNLVIQVTITNSLTESQIFSTGISLLLAAIVIIIAYRNPLLGLITMIPVAISIVWILGLMYYLGYILNPMTITVTSIIIGVGMDYAIHATERFRLIADRTGDITKAVCETISHTGGALLIAALTTALGFGILIFAPIPPLQQFGTILATTIVFSFLTSVLVLPLLLVRWAKWRKRRKGYIISPALPKNNYKNDEHFE